jgi:hypothetical protein
MAAVIGSDTVHAQTNLTLTTGSAVYSSDAFCLDSGAALTNFSAGIDGSVVGGELMFSNGAWPWPPPPGSGGSFAVFSGSGLRQEENFLTHGNAIAGVIKVFPVAVIQRMGLDGLLGNVDRYVRPYLAAGVHSSTDGETAPAGGGRDVPTYSVQGQTNFIFSYGASALLPGRDAKLGLVVEYRGSHLFAGDFDIETDEGTTQTIDGENLRFGAWSVGFRYRLGS